MSRSILAFIICLSIDWWTAALPVSAQTEIGGCKSSSQESLRAVETVSENHLKFYGSADVPVVVTCDNVEFSADEMELLKDQDRLLARGNVVFVTGGHRIYADRVDFNTKTRLGTFYVATGTATLGDKIERSFFGTQEPYATFWGQELHKIGPKKYRIVRGGFTTCAQPTPRWDVASSSVTLELDDYAILKNSILRVKGVPVMYLPVFYYPIQDDDRATGFLLPLYGNSTYRGQTLSNAFFWAISRSQDATLVHDWFTRTGQGYGGEYRYVGANSSNGTARVYVVNEHAATFTSGGRTVDSPERRSYELRASVAQALPARTRLAVNLDYFSDLTVQQLYNQNVYEASRRSRSWSASTTSSWAGFSFVTIYNRNEIFLTETDSWLDGSRPRFSFSRGATRIGKAPIYLSGNFDYANIQRESRRNDAVVNDQSISRWDSGGSIRVPFPTFSFLTVNSSLGWRGTRFSKSVDPAGRIVEEGVMRRYFDMRTEVTGPRIVRIWNRPSSRYAQRIKHLIEPTVEFRRLTAVDNFDRIVKNDAGDYIIGGSLQTRYGVTSRLFVKPSGDRAVSRELLNVSVFQTHYRDPRTSQFDPSYSTSFLGRPPSAFSPISINTSVIPAEGSQANLRIEYDPVIPALQSVSAGGSLRRGLVDVSASFSQRRLATGVGNVFRSDNYLSAGSTVRSPRNIVGGYYGFDYDFGRSTLIQQRIMGYYNAQCCGIAMEYQVYNFPSGSLFLIPQDRRFNLSFTLAGIGTFSNFLGALTGQATTR